MPVTIEFPAPPYKQKTGYRKWMAELPFFLKVQPVNRPGAFAFGYNMIDKFTNYTFKMRKNATIHVKIQLHTYGKCRGITLNIRKLIKFLFNTFVIGGASGVIISFFVKWDTYATHLNPIDWMELLGLLIFFAGLGFTFSVISMTGYFAYLYIHRFGISLFRSFWPAVQILLIAFVLFDLIYFPYRGSNGEIGIYWLIFGAVLLFLYAWLVAKQKKKETNPSAFIPTLFFMIVITTVEWTPALIAEGSDYVWLMLGPLLACNTYQIIGLHRIANREDDKSKKDPARKEAAKTKNKNNVKQTATTKA